MTTLGFANYVNPLKIYLDKYRDSVKGNKPEKLERKPYDRVKNKEKAIKLIGLVY
jgi:hypothetical protein